MKRFLAILTAAALVGGAHGATYIVSNNQGFDSSAVVDNTGTRLTNTTGSAAFGFFSSDAAVTSASSAGTLLSAFTEFGSNQATFITPVAPLSFSGLFNLQGTVSGASLDSTFAGKNIYLIAGNSTTLATATQFLVLKLTATFGSSAAEPINSTLTVDSTSGAAGTATYTVLRGSNTGPANTVSPLDGVAEASFQLAAIPEPSSVLLAGLGSLLLLRRRRG